MEAIREWNAYSTADESDFMAQLLGWSYDHHHGATGLSYPNQTTGFYGQDSGYLVSRFEESSSRSGGYYAAAENGSTMCMNGLEDPTVEINTSSYLVEDTNVSDDVAVNGNADDDHVDDGRTFCHGSKKRSRANTTTENNKRNTKARKTVQKSCENNENSMEEEDERKKKGAMKRQNSSNTTCCSDDGSCWSHETSDGSKAAAKLALNLNGKTRAGRGAATDPQSLYARKRRERINERLRILQNLVPNGTKVDISTMLEEAVQYVKFLQLQIKLLSSDDLWMYAPIAYNGMDLGLDNLSGAR